MRKACFEADFGHLILEPKAKQQCELESGRCLAFNDTPAAKDFVCKKI